MMGFSELLMMLAAQVPVLLFWIGVLIFGIIMLRRGGGRGERFLIAGAGVKILGNLLLVPRFAIALWTFPERPITASGVVNVLTGYDVFIEVVGMIGILLLLYAFWVKFNGMRNPFENPEP